MGCAGVDGKAGNAGVELVEGVVDEPPKGNPELEGWFDPKAGPELGAEGVVVKPPKPVLAEGAVV